MVWPSFQLWLRGHDHNDFVHKYLLSSLYRLKWLRGHTMTDVGSVYYDRWNYLRAKRRAMEIWSKWLETAVIRV